jgi:arsenate reductase
MGMSRLRKIEEFSRHQQTPAAHKQLGGEEPWAMRPLEAFAFLSEGASMKRVLFVCVENSNRSQMAEAFARMHGGEGVDAASAGSRPSGRINPRAVTAMQEVGYDLTSHGSKGLEDFNGTDVDVAVTMGCGDNCPLVRASRREDWQIPDPREMSPEEFREVRDLIERKVLTLLSDLGVSS